MRRVFLATVAAGLVLNVAAQQVPSVGTASEALVDHAASSPAGSYAAWGFSCPVTFSVLDFGAQGNGTADDTAAIQNALNAAAGTGGCVTFGSGRTFVISSKLVVPPGVKLTPVAGGADSTIRMSAGATGQVVLYIDDSNSGNIVINHLILDANNVYGGITIAPGVANIPPENITIQYVTVKNTGTWDGNPQSVAAIYARNARNLIIKDCIFDRTGNVRFGPCQYCQVRNSTWRNTYTGNSLSLSFAGESRPWSFGEGFVLDGNSFRDVCRMAVELFNNLPGARITNNRVENYNPSCSGVTNRYGFSLVGGGANNAVVSGNYLNGTDGGGAYGIELGWSNSTWENNEIQGFQIGIGVQGQSGNTIRGNRIYNSTYGIYLTNVAPNPNNVFEGNVIVNPVEAGLWVNNVPYPGSRISGNRVLRNVPKSGDDSRTFSCYKLDGPGGAITVTNNLCEVTVTDPSIAQGFGLYGDMGSSLYDGNIVRFCGTGTKGRGIYTSGDFLTAATIRNHHSENLNSELAGAASAIGSVSGNTYYNVVNRSPLMNSTPGAATCGS